MEKERVPSQMDEVIEGLSGILHVRERRKALFDLKGSHAQIVIDFLNSLLFDPSFMNSAEPGLRKYTLVTLRRLCENSMLYPTSYVLDGIENISHQNSEGALCDIYQGRHQGRLLCLKVVRLTRENKNEVLKVYAREAILWSQLDHLNIIPFYGVFYLNEPQQRVCLISPWMENGNIVVYLRKNPQAPRKPLIYDIASGLQYLHTENIVHGDLKGVNVLVNESERACIADFGVSSVLTNTTLAFTNATVFGRTNRWASPELLDDGSRPTCESDIWAFGCVCYEVLTRSLPFRECSSDFQIFRKLLRGDLPAQPNDAMLGGVDEVDEQMWKLMKQCWSTEAQKRPTCREILQDVESDASIWQFRYARMKGFWQEIQQFQCAMRKSSGVQVDLNQVGQILAELYSSQGETLPSDTQRKAGEDLDTSDGNLNIHQELDVLEKLPSTGNLFRSGNGPSALSLPHTPSPSPSLLPSAQTHIPSKTTNNSVFANYTLPDIGSVVPELWGGGIR